MLQSDTLTASRQAMHDALSFQRSSRPDGITIATYHSELNMAYSVGAKGQLIARMGHVLPKGEDPMGEQGRGSRLWFLPEEVIYLIERGTMHVRWPPAAEGEEGLPMSLQGAYAVFMGRVGGLTFERFSVYSSLKRLGYTVFRAASFDGAGPAPDGRCYPSLMQTSWQPGMLSLRWLQRLFSTAPKLSNDGTVTPGIYRSYREIYERLRIVQWHDPSKTRPPSEPHASDVESPLRITYNVWKPRPDFKKTEPGPPDFRIAVINARETDVPSLEELGALFDTCPYEPPKREASQQQKLKSGYKSITLAIVDQGIVSYLRLSDAAFGKEPLYVREAKGPGSKRGGRGGSRGRGRGRGR